MHSPAHLRDVEEGVSAPVLLLGVDGFKMAMLVTNGKGQAAPTTRPAGFASLLGMPTHSYRLRPRSYAWLPAVTIALLVSLAATAVTALHTLEQRAVTTAGNALALSAAELADSLNRLLFEQSLQAGMIAQSPELRQGEAERAAQYLRALRLASPAYMSIGMTDSHGRIVAATDNSSIGQDVNPQTWFQFVRQGAGIQIRDDQASLTPEDALLVAAPVEDMEGQFFGAVFLRVGRASLQYVFEGARHASGLLHGPRDYRLIASDGTVLFDSGDPTTVQTNIRSMDVPSALLTVAGKPGFIEETDPRRHVPVVTGYAQSTGYGKFPGLRWGVLVGMDRMEVVSPIRRVLKNVALWGGMAIVPLLALLLWAAHRMRAHWSAADETEGTLSHTFRCLGEAVVATDCEGHITLINALAQDVTGWTEREAKGMALADIFHGMAGRRPGAGEPLVATVLRAGRAMESAGPVRLVAKGGEERSIEYRAAPITRADGTITGVVVMFKPCLPAAQNPGMNAAAGSVASTPKTAPAKTVPMDDPAHWESVRHWVRAAEVNRVCVFQNHPGEDGAVWAGRRYEWIGLGAVARTEWSQWFSWSLRAKGFARWEETLGAGQVISGRVQLFPDAEETALSSCGIQSILVVPVFVQDQWWGFIEFDHCLSEREWSIDEIEGLTAAARMLSAALRDPQSSEDLQRVLSALDATLESTADGVLAVDDQGSLISFNQRLIGMWRIPHSVAESRTTDQLVAWMMGQLKRPDVLLRTVSELDSRPEADSYDLLELTDGRVFERFSKPKREGDQLAGRVWTFHEVTDTRHPLPAVSQGLAHSAPVRAEQAAAVGQQGQSHTAGMSRTPDGPAVKTWASGLSAHLQATREEERAKVAREIHDELGQVLTGLKIDLAWLSGKLSKDYGSVQSKVEAMSRMVNVTIDTVRRIATDLRPGVLDDLGLAATIEWQAKEFGERTGIDCRIDVPSDVDIASERALALFRIFQEVLTNVARHAQASRVHVALERRGSALVLEVKDNGKGISDEHIRDPHALGLIGMRERALLTGGDFTITGRAGEGTTVTARIPMDGEPQ